MSSTYNQHCFKYGCSCIPLSLKCYDEVDQHTVSAESEQQWFLVLQRLCHGRSIVEMILICLQGFCRWNWLSDLQIRLHFGVHGLFSNKFNGPALHYEVKVCIQSGDIVWFNGPKYTFFVGTWSLCCVMENRWKQNMAARKNHFIFLLLMET